MRRSLLAAVLGAPILFGLAVVGCGRPHDDADTASSDSGSGAPKNTAPAKALEPLEGKAGSVLKGKVTIKGKRPDLAAETKQMQDIMVQKVDQKTSCFDMAPDAEKTEQKWVIDDKGGVGNVVVWLQPAEGTFFKVDPANNGKWWPDKVELTQPHCAFVPHVSWAVPSLADPADPKKTVLSGQTFLVSNAADVSHNTQWKSDVGGSNSGQLGVIPAHHDPEPVPLKGNNQLVHFQCNIHPWMDAYVWVFNHPFAAVTKPDGTYEIKNVPAGAKVRITAWHEMGPNAGYLTASKIKGDEIELDGKDHDFELEVK